MIKQNYEWECRKLFAVVWHFGKIKKTNTRKKIKAFLSQNLSTSKSLFIETLMKNINLVVNECSPESNFFGIIFRNQNWSYTETSV